MHIVLLVLPFVLPIELPIELPIVLQKYTIRSSQAPRKMAMNKLGWSASLAAPSTTRRKSAGCASQKIGRNKSQ
jgi:hypothetical protein